MNTPKWHLANTSRIQDVKNTRPHPNHKPPLRKTRPHDEWPHPQPHHEQETIQLRSALCEAIEENEFLRERVIELEALLAEAQGRIEAIEEKYVAEMNALQRACGGQRAPPHTRSRSL